MTETPYKLAYLLADIGINYSAGGISRFPTADF